MFSIPPGQICNVRLLHNEDGASAFNNKRGANILQAVDVECVSTMSVVEAANIRSRANTRDDESDR